MAFRLDTRSPDFAQKFRAFLDTKRETSADVEAAVRAIVADVAARGDQALKEYTLKFDRLDLERVGLKVTPAEIDAAQKACSPGTGAPQNGQEGGSWMGSGAWGNAAGS